MLTNIARVLHILKWPEVVFIFSKWIYKILAVLTCCWYVGRGPRCRKVIAWGQMVDIICHYSHEIWWRCNWCHWWGSFESCVICSGVDNPLPTKLVNSENKTLLCITNLLCSKIVFFNRKIIPLINCTHYYSKLSHCTKRDMMQLINSWAASLSITVCIWQKDKDVQPTALGLIQIIEVSL